MKYANSNTVGRLCREVERSRSDLEARYVHTGGGIMCVEVYPRRWTADAAGMTEDRADRVVYVGTADGVVGWSTADGSAYGTLSDVPADWAMSTVVPVGVLPGLLEVLARQFPRVVEVPEFDLEAVLELAEAGLDADVTYFESPGAADELGDEYAAARQRLKVRTAALERVRSLERRPRDPAEVEHPGAVYALDVLADPYAWPGGYARYVIGSDGGLLCADCVRENVDIIRYAVSGDGWDAVGTTHTGEADGPLICDHCGREN